MTRVAHTGGVGPIQTVLRRMAYATVAAALMAWPWLGPHGAVSALLGGIVNIVAGAVFAWIVARGHGRTAGETLRTAVRAEATKLAVIFGLSWLVLAHYREVVAAAFLATFVLTVAIFSMAILVREK
jgi:ATP synthase protein I